MSLKDITIYDIARVLNVSPATVSRGLKDHPALREETKVRIRKAAQEMGYQQNTYARNLRTNATQTIGLIVPRLNSYFMSSVIAGIENIATTAGYNLIISQSLESAQKELTNIATMYNSRIDGILVSLAADTDDDYPFEAFIRKQIPLVYFDRVFDSPHAVSVVIDNVRAAFDATRHLIEQGCRRIVHIAGNQKRNVYIDRLLGYKMALAAYDLPFDDRLVEVTYLDEAAAVRAATRIMQMRPLPDGIFAANDTSAVTLIGELKNQNLRVPEDIAVVGFNDDPIATVIDPKLTTIRYPGTEMGEVAASTLINRIRHQPAGTSNTIILQHELIVRKSSIRKMSVL
jgi:LacI family transcriptional regulator